MAPLTWRNVDAPNLGQASSILNQAVGNWAGAFDGASDMLKEIRNRQKVNRSANAIPILAQVANSAGVDPALQQVNSMVRPQDMTPELQQAMLALRGRGLGYDSSMASTASVRGQEGRASENHRRDTTRDDQLAALTPGLVADREAAFQRHIPGILAGESGGDYDALFQFSNRPGGKFSNVKLTNMTVDQALEFANPNGEYGRWVAERNNGVVSTPMGGLQIVGSTLRDAKKGLGLKGDEVMTRDLQNKIGEWIYQNQGIGAWEGYKPGGSVASRIPEGSMIRPQDILPIIDRTYEASDRAERDRDDNRDRDTRFEREQDLARIAQVGLDSAFGAAGTGFSRPEMVQSITNNPNLTSQEKREALAQLNQLPLDDLQTPVTDFSDPGIPGLSAASLSLAQYTQEQSAALADNRNVRINENAASVYSDGSPALRLNERTGLTDETGAGTQSAINRVASALDISPARAAALLEETAGVNWKIWPGTQRIIWDEAAAIALGEDFLKPEGQRAATEAQVRGGSNIQAAQQREAAMAELVRRIELGTSRGQDMTLERGQLSRIMEESRSIYDSAPIVRSDRTTSPPQTRGGQAAQEIANTVRNNIDVPKEGLKVGAENAARELLSELAPGMSISKIASFDRDELKQQLKGLKAQIQTRGLPNEAELLLEIQAVEDALAATK